ncbi:capsular polysaccharide biosynthesis protein CapF [Vagococcus intermedius]|uniref:Capsular polysaccharide biosynthesis protein CapF n=1 Tax=Vagococcus intermedius TaxID=2991418 RepID=A0AAF0CVL2_9ENTE|nr:capsular polysaccharide biosynthesis protein CapF [Vagococcus intermedius]WEG73794.1 capsular polysaccharide biosynthesis protein CapF [Vagococcus intermedius]WEG75879.1 capsular polysaccharide biosynthesis protein CapF [Vagococcus intermedius]
MKIMITGAKGFIGQNLTAELRNQGYQDLFLVDRDTSEEELKRYAHQAEFVYHLAGVNRPERVEEFTEGNVDFSDTLLALLRQSDNKAPIIVSSSIQAELDNPYGKSKRVGEELVFNYGKETDTKVMVYRFPNVFGKWCRPNYNSAIATFCHNIANGMPITVNDPNVILNLVYIDDVVKELIRALDGNEFNTGKYCEVPVTYKQKLGWVAETIESFRESRQNRYVPLMSDELTKKLYSTYLSYLATDNFSYELKMNVDERGSFTEFLKSEDAGQVSVNISKPGITKGQHWHHTKNEKFLVVSGEGIIRFRKVNDTQVVEYPVSAQKLEVVDIPVGYTHNIENTGTEDMVTVMWVNEIFDPENPDTIFLEV